MTEIMEIDLDSTFCLAATAENKLDMASHSQTKSQHGMMGCINSVDTIDKRIWEARKFPPQAKS